MTKLVRYYSGRLKKVDKDFKEFLKNNKSKCTFCEIGQLDSINEIIEETKHFWIIKNAFPYYLWTSQEVADHLLIVPKKHIISLSEMDNKEQSELIKLLSKYDKLDYSFLERCASNASKSMPHQHTHLIKVV